MSETAEELVSLLGDAYTDVGIWIFLVSPNRNLDGRTPTDLLINGEAERVMREVRRISDRDRPAVESEEVPLDHGSVTVTDEFIERTQSARAVETHDLDDYYAGLDESPAPPTPVSPGVAELLAKCAQLIEGHGWKASVRCDEIVRLLALGEHDPPMIN